jgi:citrate synthase
METALKEGLEGVVVARTKLSHVDGEAGRLVIAGDDVEQLAGRTTYEQLWERMLGKVPDLGGARLTAMREPAPHADGMDALRASIALLSSEDPVEVAAAVAVSAAAWSRHKRGLAPIAPNPKRGHAADYLAMVTGEAHEAKARALDAYLVTVSDHGMNASTFTARVIASTGSDLVSAVTGAIGALKGPLHGGAPGPVLDMLDAVGEPSQAEAWLAGELAAGRRIMGMGHRIYRVRDPRAAVLEREVERLEAAGVSTRRLKLARAVEKAAADLLARKYPDRALKANVEFYTAVLLDAVGLPREVFSPTFAAGRVLGWCAHVEEQRKTGRLIRPASEYIGPMPAHAPHSA